MIVPFGYSLSADGRLLELHADEQQTVATIRLLRDAGTSLRGIATELNRLGLRTRSGSLWRFEYVRRTLKQLSIRDNTAA